MSTAVPRSPSVDVAHFRADLREAGIEEMVGALLKTFVEDSPGRMAALELALNEGDAEQVRSAAHAFKSGAGTIRANLLAAHLQEMEETGRAGGLEAATLLIGQIRDEYLAVQRELATTIADAG